MNNQENKIRLSSFKEMDLKDFSQMGSVVNLNDQFNQPQR